MATDLKITQLPVATSMASGDILPFVSSPSGTPVTDRITKANFLGGTNVSQVVGTTETQTLSGKTLTSPTMTAPVLGVATATTLNGLIISTTTGTLTLVNGSSLITAGAYAITLTATNTTGITLPTSGTIATLAGSEALTGKTYNGLTLTSTTGTFTLTNAKTLTVSDSTTLATNAITLGGGEVITFSASNALSLLTGGTSVMTFPTATDTVAVLGTAQTYTATQTEKQVVWTNNAITASGNAATVPITSRLNTVTNNSAATLTITMTTTSAVDGQFSIVRILDSSGVAQTITWVNTENSSVSAPTTSNGSTTLFLTVGFIYNGATSKWRCIATS
jgi:hypothetical protein